MRVIFCLLIFSSFFLNSCEKVNCDKLAKTYLDDNCNIIVLNMPISQSRHNFYIVGKSNLTNIDTIYDEENRWFCQLYKYIKHGDTIIKKRGELVFSIHSKDTVFNFTWECNGKKYIDE